MSCPGERRPGRGPRAPTRSVFRLVDACLTTASTWLVMGERMSVRGAVRPPASEPRQVLDPGVAQPAGAASHHGGSEVGRAERRLGDPGDPDPAGGQPADEVAGVGLDRVEVDLQARRGHRVLATRLSLRAGKASSTMSASWSSGRVSGSVAGSPRSSSISSMAALDLGVVGHALVVDGDADDPGVGEGSR